MVAGGARVGVVHAPGAAASLREIAVSSSGLCVPVILVPEADAVAFPEFVRVARRSGECHLMRSWDEVADLGLDGLLTFHDDHLDLVDDLLARAGRRSAPATKAWDKLVQRRIASSAGLSPLAAVPVDSAADLVAASRAIGLPGVLKPRRGAQGQGVLPIADAEALRAVLARPSLRLPGYVYEGFIRSAPHPGGPAWLGDFVSVEMASTAREHRPVAIFDKLPVRTVLGAPDGPEQLVVSGDLFPTRLSPDRRADAVQFVSAELDGLGVRWRLTHTELKITHSGFELLEVNGRLGGDLQRVLDLVHGPNLVRMALELSLGIDVVPPARPVTGWAAGYYPPFERAHGLVVADVDAGRVRRLPGVVGVDFVARRGHDRSRDGVRAVDVTVRSGSAEDLDRDLVAISEELRTLYPVDRVQPLV